MQKIKYRQPISFAVALITWFALVVQYVLMIENSTANLPEATIRFFSFFTILSNTAVALLFTCFALRLPMANRDGLLTCITVYITIVGLVYQTVLRFLWSPTGMQQVVDELLHSVIPLLVLACWFRFEDKTPLQYRQVWSWLLFPTLYFGFILIRGSISGFYPYPFIHVLQIGWSQTLLHALMLTVVFALVSILFVWIGKRLTKPTML